MKDPAANNSLSEVHSLLIKEDSTSWIGQGLEAIVIAMAILFVVYLVLRVLKDKAILNIRQKKDQEITIEAVKPLSQQTKILVIKWQGKEYLISESKNGCSVIDHREVTQETDR